MLIGFGIDIMNVLCVELYVCCVWVELSFDGMILGLFVCKFDVIVLLMMIMLKWM